MQYQAELLINICCISTWGTSILSLKFTFMQYVNVTRLQETKICINYILFYKQGL